MRPRKMFAAKRGKTVEEIRAKPWRKTKKTQGDAAQEHDGRLHTHKDCVRGPGPAAMRHTVEVEDTPAMRGMINRVSYMLWVEE